MPTCFHEPAPDELVDGTSPHESDPVDPPHESDPGVIARVIDNRKARRELIWLSHMAKGDHANACDIERYDRHIRRRLAPSFARLWRALHTTECRYCNAGLGRETLYAILFDQRWRHHAARHAGVPCTCLDCGGSFSP